MCDNNVNNNNNKNENDKKGDEDMGKLAEIKPFEVNFEEESEREEFIRWANSKSRQSNKNKIKMIQEMKKLREIRKRGRH